MKKERKIHKPLLFAIVEIIYEIFADGKMADKAIQKALKSNPKWGSRDRAFIASYSYNIVRWWRLLHFINESEVDNHSKNTIWKLLGTILRLDGNDLPELDQFKGVSRSKIKERFDLGQTIRKVRESIPDWFDEVGEKELGESWDEELHGMNAEARVGLRINLLKINKKDLKMILKKDGIYTDDVIGVPNGLFLEERKNLFGTKAFRNGFFEVQDPGSQMIADFLGVGPDMRVIDACAGAGGKTLSLAAQMNNKGTIIALDVEEWKLKELKRRAKRAGAHNIDTRLIVNNKVIKRLKESADRLLLDVPCSGTGVLRRNPDAKWKLDQPFLDRIRKTQRDIILSYANMVKPNGIMVYATCSILPSENRDQVDWFLKQDDRFELVEDKSVSPARDGFDGFYMARLHRKP